MASVRRGQVLPPCWTQTVPASSKTDPWQGTAEPISQAGGAPGKTQVRAENLRQAEQEGKKESEKQPCEHHHQRRKRGRSRYFPVSHGGPQARAA